MRRKEKEIQDSKVIDEILTHSVICRVAMFDEKYPYMLPFNYGYDNNALYIHSATTGKKLDLIEKNNHVCFEIELNHEIIKYDQSCKWTTKYRSIVGFGRIEVIKDFEDKVKGLDIIMQHHGKKDNAYIHKAVDKMVIMKLTVDSLTGKQGGDWPTDI